MRKAGAIASAVISVVATLLLSIPAKAQHYSDPNTYYWGQSYTTCFSEPTMESVTLCVESYYNGNLGSNYQADAQLVVTEYAGYNSRWHEHR